MRSILGCLIVFIIAIFGNNTFAQPGSNDPTFNTIDNGFWGDGSGMNNRVNVTCLQPDGKILVGGNFTFAQGVLRRGIVRLNSDGTIDQSFNANQSFSSINDPQIDAIVLQPDGKILIAGNIALNNGNHTGIFRLNNDGSIDSSFDPGTNGFTGSVSRLALQSDGKILCGGNFTQYNGNLLNRICRLNSDGSLDNSFFVGTGFTATVKCIKVQSNGNIIVGGFFSGYNGTSSNRIIRLNSNGTIDPSFNIGGSGFNNSFVSDLALQPDGKIIVGGSFITYNGISANAILRLNSNGTQDNSFISPFTPGEAGIDAMDLQSDGKIIIGGGFLNVNGIFTSTITRLNPNGTRDLSFSVLPGFVETGAIYSLTICNDGKIIAGGNFNGNNKLPRCNLTKLNSNGSTDQSFFRNVGLLYYGFGEFAQSPTSNRGGIVAAQPDGKIICTGGMTYNDTIINYFARLTNEGFIDYTFNTGSGFGLSWNTFYSSPYLNAICLQSDGKILCGGQFDSYNGTTVNNIVRLNSDGSIDLTFNAGAGCNGIVYDIILQPDGKIIIGGMFTTVNGTNRGRIARLNANGSLDLTFDTGTSGGFNNRVNSIVLQSDGKVLVGGLFTSYNSNTRNYFARLNVNGSLDATLNPLPGFNSYVNDVVVQNNGKILVVGGFTAFNGISKNKIISLNNDGSIDSGFFTGNGFTSGEPGIIRIQTDGKLLIGGALAYNNTTSSGLIRLNPDGSVDNYFNVGSGFNSALYGLAIHPDGKIITSGRFTFYKGIQRSGIARLIGVCQPSQNTMVQSACGPYVLNGQTYSSSGIFTQLLTNSSGCDSTIILNLTINNVPIVNAGQDQVVCQGNLVTLQGSGANSYLWTNNVQNNVPFSPQLTQTYTVTGTDVNGCSNTDQVTVTVNPLPSVNAGQDQSVCQGGMVTLAGSGANNYSWNNNVQNNIPFTPIASQTYTVSGTDINNCSNTDQVTVTVNPLPSVNAGQDQLVCQGDIVTLAGSGANNYAWTNNVQNNIPFSPQTTQTYTVTGTDNNNCSATDNVIVTVNMNSSAIQAQSAIDSYTWPVNGQTYMQSGTYTAIVPNAQGCDSTITLNLTLSYTGIDELFESVSIYPNPTNSTITIETQFILGSEIVIVDSQGRELIKKKISATKEQFDLSAVANGIYYLSMANNSKFYKIVKQ